jgi:hypothetical protein
MSKKMSALVLTVALSLTRHADAQTTAFTYQGKLSDSNKDATGLYDMSFTLFDSASSQNQVGFSLAGTIPVTNGLFTANLDFGSTPFNGASRWLQIGVKTNGNLGSYTILNPSIQLAPTPYAIYAQSAGAVANGAVGNSQLAPNAVGSSNLQVSSVTSAKIASGQVVKSLNGLKDDVNLIAGANVTLSTNGSGVTINSIGSGAFSLNGANAYYNGGNVGIGTTTPQSRLHLQAQPGQNSYLTFDTSTTLAECGINFNQAGSTKWWAFCNDTTSDLQIETPNGENDTIPRIRLPYANKDVVLALSGGNVGIGVASPTSTLDVGGNTQVRGRINFYSPGQRDMSLITEGVYPNHSFTIYDGTTGIRYNRLTIAGNGNVGIGTATPSSTLDVNGNASVCSLTIRGGCDLAEPFEVSSKDIPKGSVMVIDKANPGQLKLCTRAYDTQVAGIISGANGINPGISLHQEGAIEGGQNVALSGRVFAQADASNGPIEPGDLLTTSSIPGHCMKATDQSKSQGAIIGKAMTALEDGKGMVLVLVSLQ